MNTTTLEFERSEVVAIVSVAGRLDGNTAPVFNRFLADHLGEDDLHVVLDVTGLEFISSAGLREFMTLLKRLGKQKARPAICGVGTNVGQAIEIAGFKVLFEHAHDRASAIRAVNPAASKKPGLLERLLGKSERNP
jgi:anti-anti-sigma factor